jgi:hypothetical protein
VTSTALVVIDDLEKPVGALDGLSVTDKRLLQLAREGKSPDEIAEELGGLISAARAASRIREILRSHDWLSMEEQQGLLLLDMVEVKEILMQHVRNEGGYITDQKGNAYYAFGDPRWSANLIRLLDSMQKGILAARQDIDTAKVKIRRKHAAVMTQAIQTAFRILARAVVARTDMTEQQMLALLEDAIPQAIAIVEANAEQGED